MLKNIQSYYFIQIIFAYIDEKQILKTIKYNKSLQKTINISIINYIRYSGRYIVYGTNGIGKEYNGKEDRLIYEGEYFHGERNGKGKEYDTRGKLIFEGEFLNNKQWKGKGYDDDNVVYELNNNINGKGREYYNYGDLKYEGEYLNGRKNGKGKEYFFNQKLRFEGEYKNDLQWDGKGYDKSKKIVYELKNGKGLKKDYDDSGDMIYASEYLNGKRNGKGEEYDWDVGFVFKGEYLNGKRNGKGKEFFCDELIFEGEYLYDDKLKGKLYVDNKLEYEGEYLYDKKWNGKGYDKDGNIIYELINGNGRVKEYNKNCKKLIFKGEYLNGKRNGKGEEYWGDGMVKFEGEYLNGQKCGKGKKYHHYSGKVTFEGEYLNGKRWNGIGKKYIFEKLRFEVEYLNGIKMQKNK